MKLSHKSRYYLGIDIGSVSLAYVLINEIGEIINKDYLFHRGDIFKILQKKLQEIELSRVMQIAFNHKANDFFSTGISVNEQVALIEGVRFQQQSVGSVFTIGGETFGLILFDENNQYQRYISNSSCAAGTGAFLDQQAERLGLSGSAELSRLAESFHGEPPRIATRCAVFAKTDLVHCHQQGYPIEAISAGLCKGLAHNIVDTLLKGIKLREPVAVVGGVSKNPKVMYYLSELIGRPVLIPENAVFTAAIGCALVAKSRSEKQSKLAQLSLDALFKKPNHEKHYFFAPLSSRLSAFPDFSDHSHFVLHDVEVDLYDFPPKKYRNQVYLGIDIGSTSTKAVVTDAQNEDHRVLLGLYTRTLGQPIQATQALFKVLSEIAKKYEIHFEFRGVGSTGSGRKFIRKVIYADLAIDEITAHARAACSLNPAVDTIIEIGGQDSKFTVVKNGQVTFSVMNYVCAAGTGSFIEEQARRLNVPLEEYAELAMGSPAPLTSDRCTVFMERDLNHYMAQGYVKEELLAAALHSVRDNYLSKVAHISKIGNVICFQGATAKNKALVMAFEQKLQKPIFVSKYCHLTGALGVCLLLKEKEKSKTSFRGLQFYKESPVVFEEICDLCKNHCKLNRVQIAQENIVWGFLCGRDESSKTRKSRKHSEFDLLSSRRAIFNPVKFNDDKIMRTQSVTPKSVFDTWKSFAFDLSLEKLKQGLVLSTLNLRHSLFTISRHEGQLKNTKKNITVGIPNTLYMQEYITFWKLFFKQLGYTVLVSSSKAKLMQMGKEIAGAEFCAPISYWHGHVQEISSRVDYLFLPHMFEGGENQQSRFFCYYCNYAVALLQNIPSLHLKNKCISPIIDFSKPVIDNVQQIYESLPPDLKFTHTPGEIREAYLQVWRWFNTQKQQLVEIFLHERKFEKDISVVLLGRPYIVMDPVMNQNIPQKFSDLSVKTFYQDMLPVIPIEPDTPAKEFVDWNHWKYGANILQAAEYIAQCKGLYPVYLSAFKCSPDSFVLTYFKEIMDAYEKPYLILQIDEHGSDVGYETRVESAVEAFRNHFQQKTSISRTKWHSAVLRAPDRQQTILIPNYDSLSCSLICAAFEHAGYHTRLIEETPMTVVASLRLNDGQCLPISAIVQAAIETIQKYHLIPETTAIFMNAITRIACNFPQYPIMMKKLLEQNGNGFEKVQVIGTEFEMTGFPFDLIYDVYFSYLFGGLLRKMACKIRPYEIIPGKTDRLIEQARQKLYRGIAHGTSKEVVFKEIVAEFSRIPVGDHATRPRVAIIGDLYVRDNDVFNQQLIHELEDYGAEVVTTPFNYILRMLAHKSSRNLWQEGRFLSLLRNKLLMEFFEKFEKRFFDIANTILCEEFPTFNNSIFKHLKKYNLSLKHGGETAQNLLKIFSLIEHYPDLSLFIHVNPIFCCPGLVSESIFKTVEKDIGVPIVSIVYDGTTANRNEVLAPYMHYLSYSP